MKYIFVTGEPRICEAESSQGIREFAEKHGLEMVVVERGLDRRLREFGVLRYYAEFKHVDAIKGALLEGVFGNGDTPEAAIADYAEQILGRQLVYDADDPGRRVFAAPNEWTGA